MEQPRVVDHQKTLCSSPENRIFTLCVQTPAKTLRFSFLLELMLYLPRVWQETKTRPSQREEQTPDWDW